MDIEKKLFWFENGSIHWEQQRMSGELLNETDNKFYIFYFGQQGLWAQGFGKTEQNWHCTLVIALNAAVGLLSNVGERMPLEVISKCARITAMFTCKTFSPV